MSAFGTIVANTINFAARTVGTYMEEGLAFGDPQSYIRIRPGARRKDGQLSAGITRVMEKDVTVGDDVERHNCVVTLNIIAPPSGSFTASEIDSMVSDISSVATVDNLNAILQGKA